MNSDGEKGRLVGLFPCMEDWHTKVILLEVNNTINNYYVSILMFFHDLQFFFMSGDCTPGSSPYSDLVDDWAKSV